MPHRVLIVEDDPDLAFGLRNNLEIEGYVVDTAADGVRAAQVLSQERYDLVLLDLMLPGMDGLRVLRTIRERGDRTPVLILTARGQEEDKVRGLRLGADDYVTKPFGVLELLARIEALLRRAMPVLPATDSYRFGAVEIDGTSRTVKLAGSAVELSPKEFDLLFALVRAQGAVCSRQALMREVWGYEASVLSRTVDTHMAELRRKLEADASAPEYLLTVRKVGYRLNVDASKSL
jgi:two-component system, OmpR family, alkaline phosphatase synthesis response regulator PhoP